MYGMLDVSVLSKTKGIGNFNNLCPWWWFWNGDDTLGGAASDWSMRRKSRSSFWKGVSLRFRVWSKWYLPCCFLKLSFDGLRVPACMSKIPSLELDDAVDSEEESDQESHGTESKWHMACGEVLMQNCSSTTVHFRECIGLWKTYKNLLWTTYSSIVIKSLLPMESNTTHATDCANYDDIDMTCPSCGFQFLSSGALIHHFSTDGTQCISSLEEGFGILTPPVYGQPTEDLFGKDETLLDHLKDHEHERCCEHLIYYPFADEGEWELAKFLALNLNKTQVSQFLKLWWVILFL